MRTAIETEIPLPEDNPPKIQTRYFNQATQNRAKLFELLRRFNREVWPDIDKRNQDPKAPQGFSIKIKDVTIRTWCNDYRLLIVLQKDMYRYLSLVCEKYSFDCGIKGMWATYPDMHDMLETVIKGWPRAKRRYKPDPKLKGVS